MDILKLFYQPISTHPQHSLSERRPPCAEKEEDGAPAPGVRRGQPHPLPQGRQGRTAAGQHARGRPEEQPDADAGGAGPAAAPCEAAAADGPEQAEEGAGQPQQALHDPVRRYGR